MAQVTYVNVGPFGNLGTCTTLGVGCGTQISKSFSYDEAQYQYSQSMIGLIGTDTSAASLSCYFPAYTQKQVKSITIVPVVIPAAAEYILVDLFSMQPQTFGTATGTLCYNIAAASGAVQGSTIVADTPGFLGTVEGTGYNQVRLLSIVGNAGTAIGGVTGSMAFGFGTQSAYNPIYVNLAGATATVVVAGPVGTNSQANYVFPIGPNGGLSMYAGDVLRIQRGTGSGAYSVEVEFTYTPGATVTR